MSENSVISFKSKSSTTLRASLFGEGCFKNWIYSSNSSILGVEFQVWSQQKKNHLCLSEITAGLQWNSTETKGQLHRNLLPVILKLRSHVLLKISVLLVSYLLKTNYFHTYWMDASWSYDQFCFNKEVACRSRLVFCPPMGCYFNVCLPFMWKVHHF